MDTVDVTRPAYLCHGIQDGAHRTNKYLIIRFLADVRRPVGVWQVGIGEFPTTQQILKDDGKERAPLGRSANILDALTEKQNSAREHRWAGRQTDRQAD